MRDESVQCDIRVKADPSNFVTKTISYVETEIIETEEESEMLDDLSIEEQAWFLQGEIYVISMMVFQLEKQRI